MRNLIVTAIAAFTTFTTVIAQKIGSAFELGDRLGGSLPESVVMELRKGAILRLDMTSFQAEEELEGFYSSRTDLGDGYSLFGLGLREDGEPGCCNYYVTYDGTEKEYFLKRFLIEAKKQDEEYLGWEDNMITNSIMEEMMAEYSQLCVIFTGLLAHEDDLDEDETVEMLEARSHKKSGRSEADYSKEDKGRSRSRFGRNGGRNKADKALARAKRARREQDEEMEVFTEDQRFWLADEKACKGLALDWVTTFTIDLIDEHGYKAWTYEPARAELIAKFQADLMA